MLEAHHCCSEATCVNHAVQICMARGTRTAVRSMCVKHIGEAHARLEEEYWKRVEANTKARAAHLRASDFNAYLDEVEKQGDEHVDKLLQDSNSCLLKILTRLSQSRKGGARVLPWFFLLACRCSHASAAERSTCGGPLSPGGHSSRVHLAKTSSMAVFLALVPPEELLA